KSQAPSSKQTAKLQTAIHAICSLQFSSLFGAWSLGFLFLEKFVPEFLSDLPHQLFDALGLALGADHRRVFRVNDNHVRQADGGEQMAGVGADDDVAVGVEEDGGIGVDSVVVLAQAWRMRP